METMMQTPSRWMNWIGFVLGALAIAIADPAGNKYWIVLTVGLFALLSNAVALLLRKQADRAR